MKGFVVKGKKPQKEERVKLTRDNRDEDNAYVIANAHHYSATAFLGRATYERVDVPTLEEARKAAAGLYRDRPVMIYAVALNLDGATARTVHVENWEPKKEKTK